MTKLETAIRHLKKHYPIYFGGVSSTMSTESAWHRTFNTAYELIDGAKYLHEYIGNVGNNFSDAYNYESASPLVDILKDTTLVGIDFLRHTYENFGNSIENIQTNTTNTAVIFGLSTLAFWAAPKLAKKTPKILKSTYQFCKDVKNGIRK